MPLFEYSNVRASGAFLLMEVSDWIVFAEFSDIWEVRLKNGRVHPLTAEEFTAFDKQWKGRGYAAAGNI